MDDQRRIALVDTRSVGDDGSQTQLIRYQLAEPSRLGRSLEADQQGAVITYEEYHPYGTTSWQAGRTLAEVSLKRYRYTGMERDEESGFGYHGARYYAPWLATLDSSGSATLVERAPTTTPYRRPTIRWSCTDPNGMQTGAPNETDHVIMQMTDPELHNFMSGLSPDLQVAFAAGASGAFAQRAAKMVLRYNLLDVKITSTTRTIGDVAKYSDQGKANYLDMFGSRRRADRGGARVGDSWRETSAERGERQVEEGIADYRIGGGPITHQDADRQSAYKRLEGGKTLARTVAECL